MAGISYPKTGIDVVLLEPVQLDRRRRVEKDDDLAELAALGDHLNHIPFVLVQGKLADAFPVLHEEIDSLGAFARKDDEGDIVVVVGPTLANGVRIEFDRIFAEIDFLRGVAADAGHTAILIGFPKGRIDFESGPLHRLLERGHVGLLGHVSGGVAAIDRIDGGVSEHRHAAFLALQGQSFPFIAEKDGPLAHLVDALLLGGGDQLFLIGGVDLAELAFVVRRVLIGILRRLDDCRLESKARVDDVRIAESIVGRRGHQDEQSNADGAHSAP